MKRRNTSNPPDVELEAEDGIAESVQDRAKTKIAELARFTGEPILHARVRLSRSRNPAVSRPMIAQGNLDVNGQTLRAQVAPPYYPLPEQQRRVVRHKTFGPSLATPDEAAFDLDMLDYEFYLFTEEHSGQDTVIYRAGPTGYRMAQVDPKPGRTWTTAVPLTVSEEPAPRLTVAEAQTRLDATGLPFLFFAEPNTGRGRVLYRRYDGHYGLVRPAD